MNEILNTIILIILIVVLIIAYILISYFYKSYDENKQLVNYNFRKTANYINDTNNTINSSITALNNKTSSYDSQINLISSYTTSNVNNLNSNFNIYKATLDPQISNLNSNLTNFDSGLKNYVNFKINNNSINDKIYSYQFGVNSNLSMELLRNIDVMSGMTIRTNNERLFRVCDNANNCNCIDLNVNNGNFNIYPSNTNNNAINNLNIMTSNKDKVLANFNFNQKSIYLGGAGEEAGLFINESNVYVKNLNLMKSGSQYADTKSIYDFNTPLAANNTFKYDYDRLTKSRPIRILGNYTINATTVSGVTTTRLDILLKSKYDIPSGTAVSFEIFELNSTVGNGNLANGNVSSPLTTLNKSSKILSGTIGVAVPANTTVHFYYSNTNIQIDPVFAGGTNYSGSFIIDL